MKQERDIQNLKIIEKNSNVLFTEEQVDLRQKNGFWTYEMLDTYHNTNNIE